MKGDAEHMGTKDGQPIRRKICEADKSVLDSIDNLTERIVEGKIKSVAFIVIEMDGSVQMFTDAGHKQPSAPLFLGALELLKQTFLSIIDFSKAANKAQGLGNNGE